MIDRYTKVILTIIAASLAIIAAQNFIQSATAQVRDCGDAPSNACYVAAPPGSPLYIEPASKGGLFAQTVPGANFEVKIEP